MLNKYLIFDKGHFVFPAIVDKHYLKALVESSDDLLPNSILVNVMFIT